MVCVTYCMYSKEEVLRFCFECFDKDGSGTIDEKEFIDLCRTVNNAAPLFPGNFGEAVAQFDTNDDGLIDFAEFLELDRRYPLILFPAFRLQDRMQQRTLGEPAWVLIREGIQRYKRIKEYMDTHGGQLPPANCVSKYLSCLAAPEVKMDSITRAQNSQRAAREAREKEKQRGAKKVAT